jgi:hypothetical protein
VTSPAAVPVYPALQRVRAADQRGFILALVAALFLAAAARSSSFDIAQLGVEAGAHAYRSIFAMLASSEKVALEFEMSAVGQAA